MTAYLPSALLSYFEEIPPHPYSEYEYQILFGYIRWARSPQSRREAGLRTRLTPLIESETHDIELLRWKAIPPFIKGAKVIGIDSTDEFYAVTYEDLVKHYDGHNHPLRAHLAPMMVAYLASFDTFQWRHTLFKLRWGMADLATGLVAAARVAASCGNFPLTCEIYETRVVSDSHMCQAFFQLLHSASPTPSFWRKLARRYKGCSRPPDIDTGSDAFEKELLATDNLEMFEVAWDHYRVYDYEYDWDWDDAIEGFGAKRIGEFIPKRLRLDEEERETQAKRIKKDE